MSMGVEISIFQEGDIHLVIVEGRLDATTAPIMEKKISKLLDLSEKMVIDFSGVDYLSSAGMRLLLSMTKKMHAKKKAIAFFGMTDEVLEIIKMAGFERVLNIFKSKSDALKSLS